MFRLILDLNVYVQDVIAMRRGRSGSAASQMVEYARQGRCPAGPIQLSVSIPMLENLENVLVRKFAYSPGGAKTKVDAIRGYAKEGPMPVPPVIVLGAGHVAFETEMQNVQSLESFRRRNDGSLFHSTQDDRYVLETALATRADLLVTSDIHDFRRGPFDDLDSEDVHVCRTSDHAVVVAKPHWARERLMTGIRPSAADLMDVRALPGTGI